MNEIYNKHWRFILNSLETLKKDFIFFYDETQNFSALRD